jgi:hypothetical protein
MGGTYVGHVKLKLPCTHTAGAKGKYKYNSYSILTSALDGVSGQHHTSATLYPRYPLDRRLNGPQSWSGRRG